MSRFWPVVYEFLALWVAAAATFTSYPAFAAGSERPPNILVILADDLGYSDLHCYGGEIDTPILDSLAAGGLRFTQFYNTARCWPTRASLLSGYYAQQVRMDPPKGRLPAWAPLLPQRLKPLGYRSYHSGKWHISVAPLADGGFDRSYRFEDWDRYFTPAKHFEDDQPLPPVPPEAGYYATTAFADHAIRCLKEHKASHADRPFFQFLAFTCPHFPLHALPADVERYRDRYLDGWDTVRQRRWLRQRDLGLITCDLPPRDVKFTPRYFEPKVLDQLGAGEAAHALAWNELNDEQRRYQATKMALHAAMVDRMDCEIGRVVDQIRSMGALEDTLILFFSDNGADATVMVRGEGHDRAAVAGSRQSFLCLGPGWATVSNTPFRWHKIWTHEGGISTPLIIHWPRGIRARGELRHTVGHVIDLVPTVLELAGAVAADLSPTSAPPLPGVSLVSAFDEDVPLERELFFHHEGNRALRVGNWKLVSARENDDVWEFYDLAADRCELKDLAPRHPDRVREMAARWQELETTLRRQAEE
jgi:arylsulfatase A-like enzyme